MSKETVDLNRSLPVKILDRMTPTQACKQNYNMRHLCTFECTVEHY